jgi:hypothetical protein
VARITSAACRGSGDEQSGRTRAAHPAAAVAQADEFGFREVWAVDLTGIAAYGDAELLGLHPEEWRGYHERPYASRKPYG